MFENKRFVESFDEVVNSMSVCVTNQDNEIDVDCGESPEDCYDCNRDGTPECMTGDYCDYYALFEYTDSCVTPGETKYLIRNERQEYSESSEVVDVTDTGDPCLDASDADADSDSDNDSDNDCDNDSDSADSCSVTSVGSSASPYVLTLIMLAIGLVAARVGRER